MFYRKTSQQISDGSCFDIGFSLCGYSHNHVPSGAVWCFIPIYGKFGKDTNLISERIIAHNVFFVNLCGGSESCFSDFF